ncbi:hypothetical protein M422DRAFT_72101 [Sphaerobolus stellatus SS14]|uniref:HMG box domain-containing protein n=1 Tax=Sphaerobolus stellatus (strain SS14) TaxID=990650 RepID=A0A0C9UJP2_SPHS4|nr:hypothetical protein M422DRAFT_72101 [Sphaerobolus stellatus SS14]
MLSKAMLALSRTVVSRVALRPIVLAPIHRVPAVSGLLTRRAFSTTPSILAPAAAAKKAPARKTAAKPKPKAKAAVKKAPAKRKTAAKTKTRAQSVRKAAPKKKAPSTNTRVPLSLRPPKKPAGPYFIFVSRTRPASTSTMAEHIQANKDSAAIWKKLTDSEKQPFKDEYKILFADYVARREKWFKDPKNAPIFRTLNKDRKKRGKKIIHRPDGVVPKRPLTGYFRFLQQLRDQGVFSPENAPAGTNIATWTGREGGARWKTLPESEKAKFNAQYYAEKNARARA